MTPQKATPEGDVPSRQVSNILQNLRGEHFRQVQNIQGRRASSSALSSHAHNRPTLPLDLIFPPGARLTELELECLWGPGPSPPKSWRSPVKSKPSSILWPIDVRYDVDANTPAWRECALSLLFAADTAPFWSTLNIVPPGSGLPRAFVHPHPGSIPPLTHLCLGRLRAACTGADLAHVAPHIPPHLRRALVRYAAVYAPLSQIELDALCQGETHVDTELIVIAPHNTLREDFFRKKARDDEDDPNANASKHNESQWDATQVEEDSELHSLAIVGSHLLPATMLTFPPTITHLALIDLYLGVPLKRLPAICPLLVFLDLSYNKWLYVFNPLSGEGPVIMEVKWRELRKLEVLGLRGCFVDRELLLKVNKGRVEDVKIIQ